jgi:hypothetical protein
MVLAVLQELRGQLVLQEQVVHLEQQELVGQVVVQDLEEHLVHLELQVLVGRLEQVVEMELVEVVVLQVQQELAV